MFTVTPGYRGDKFFVREDGILKATPLFCVLAVIELSDVIFAVDSIPAIFGVTLDPVVVYTSNMAAILSLRALYGFVASVMSELRCVNLINEILVALRFFLVACLGFRIPHFTACITNMQALPTP